MPKLKSPVGSQPLTPWEPMIPLASSWDVDPCPTCGEQVMGMTMESTPIWYGSYKTTVHPCNHEVAEVQAIATSTTAHHLTFKKAIESDLGVVEPLFLGQVYQDLVLEYQKNGLSGPYIGDIVKAAGSSPWPSSGLAMLQGVPIYGQLLQSCPALGSSVVTCPQCGTPGYSLGNLIPHLNDKHKWSREKIADWLETLDVDLTIQRVKESV